jgi:predicted transcriptional regulator
LSKRERRVYYLDPELVRRLRIYAADRNVSHSDVVEAAVREKIGPPEVTRKGRRPRAVSA